MSKFDIMVHGDLNRYSALNLKEIMWEIVGKDGPESSWHIVDLDVKWAMCNDPSNFGFMASVISDDCGTFMVTSQFNGTTMKIMKIRDALSVISNVNDHERPLIVINNKHKRLHQVIDHAIDRSGIVLLLDTGDAMSDDIMRLWSESGPMGKYA